MLSFKLNAAGITGRERTAAVSLQQSLKEMHQI